MEPEEYAKRMTAAYLREADQMNLGTQQAMWNRLTNHVDKNGRYTITSTKELFDFNKVVRQIKGQNLPEDKGHIDEMQEKLDRVEQIRREAQRRVAERRKLNAD